MKTPVKILIVAALAVVVVGAVALKKGKAPTETNAAAPLVAASGTAEGPAAKGAPVATAKLPKLIDLGAGKCIPCKMMAPILEELKKEYADRFITQFIDVWENPDTGKPYGIEMIPTQIFFDAEGKELFRHVGFFGKEDILGKWKELGVDVSGRKPSAGIVRETPVAADTRSRDTVCFMCDGDVNTKTKTLVKGATEKRILCSPHCYFIYFSSLVGADAKDGFSGELIRIKTLNGSVAALEPASAIAWFGQNKNAEGKWVSAGCFKQGFFVSGANLQKWLDARTAMTGRQITIAQALAGKMKLAPQQIAKACKLGECN